MKPIKQALGLTEAISIKRQTILAAIFFALFFFLAILQPALGGPFHAWVDENGVLHVDLFGDNDVKITCEDGYVKADGMWPNDPAGNKVPCADIKGIVVNGGEGDNKIDLGDVGPENFPNVENVEINGGAGNDKIIGSGFDDTIDGGAGNDSINGGAGNDEIDGGSGEDELDGGAGNDWINGGTGEDWIYGMAGNDRINGGDHLDIINGGAGNDIIHGGAGNDHIEGGAGTDTIFGENGRDIIRSGDGTDFIDGGADHDVINGGAGNDVINGGPGKDYIDGGIGNDIINGGDGDDIVEDFYGDDLIVNRPGSDDIIIDHDGNDTLDFFPAASGITIDMDMTDVDQVVDAAGNTVRLEGQFENFIGSGFDDLLFVDPLTVPRNLGGGAGNDTLSFDAKGVPWTDDGTTITAEGYAPVAYISFETVNISNTTGCLPSIEVNKMVFNETSGEWVDETTAKVNDTLRFRCVVHNNGTCCNLTDITVTDILSDSLEYRDNATVDGVAAEPTAVSENEYKWEFAGPLAPCEAITIEFDARVIECGNDKNTQNASAWCEETGTWVSDEDTVWVNCTAVPPLKPDLIITEKWVCWPENCTICYNVKNIGEGTAPACHNATLYVDGVAVAHDHVPVDLAPGESYTGYFNGYVWTYTPPSDDITVCADNNETLDELDEDNNCLTNIWMCGDVRKDGFVTAWDVAVLNSYVAGIGELEVERKWAGDVRTDGYITAWDVAVLNSKVAGIGAISCMCTPPDL